MNEKGNRPSGRRERDGERRATRDAAVERAVDARFQVALRDFPCSLLCAFPDDLDSSSRLSLEELANS